MMVYLAPVLLLLILLYLVYRLDFFRLPGLRPWMVPSVFLLKVLAGIGLFLVYSNYYTYRNTSDAFRYYDDAAVMFSAMEESPGDYFKMLTGVGSEDPSLEKYYVKMNNWNLGRTYNFYNDNRTITRFIAFVMFFAFGSYHVHTILMCFLALTGLAGMYRFLVSFGVRASPWLFCCVFLAPSVMFWGSGVLKEGLLLFGMGLFLYGFVFLLKKQYAPRYFLLILFGIIVLLMIKVYVLLLLIPCLLAFSWTFLGSSKHIVYSYIVPFVICAGVLELFRVCPGVPDPVRLITEKQNDFCLLARGGTYVVKQGTGDTIYFPLDGKENVPQYCDSLNICRVKEGSAGFYWKHRREAGEFIASKEDGFRILLRLTYTGSKLESDMLEPTRWSWARAAPMALVNAVFRPFLWEATNVFMLAAACENLLIVILMIVSVLLGRFIHERANVIFFCLAFFFMMSLLIGLVTPVAGAIVRYKVPALPFLFVAFYCLLDEGKKAGIFLKRWKG